MTSLIQRNEILHQRQAGLANSIWSAITSSTIAGILGLAASWSACWAAEPPIPPAPPPGLNVVQFYNQSDRTILLGAFGPTSVEPLERGVLGTGATAVVDFGYPGFLGVYHIGGKQRGEVLGTKRMPF